MDTGRESVVVAVVATLSILLLSLLPSEAVFVFKTGRCPHVGAQQGLDRAKFSGIWYEYKRFPAIFEAGLACSAAIYGDAGDRLTMVTEGTRRMKFFGKHIVLKKTSVEGFATVPEASKPSEFNVSFGGEFAWILTRVRGEAPSNLATLEAHLALAGVDLAKFKLVDQNNCDSGPPSGGNDLDAWFRKF
ncbi:apolipoprotein d [Plakobranchus ocellatus]|uniref:Apolipoprotein d n=1 Tax=Plakobranchus ocellatus TaxID=259542 RepID=A0AAV4D7Y0_9GAST|nr:apolipoprotein d [Plakobranchus ocellatus]